MKKRIKKTENRGGSRVAGPGKKNGRPYGDKPPKVAVSYKIDPELKAYLDSLGKGNASPTVEATLRRSKGFRDWVREQGIK